jgi:hypothetical protein
MNAQEHSKIEAEVAHASSQTAKLERERDEYKKLVRLLQEETSGSKKVIFSGAEGSSGASMASSSATLTTCTNILERGLPKEDGEEGVVLVGC